VAGRDPPTWASPTGTPPATERGGTVPPIRSWRSPGIEVRDGAVAGLGVFAVEPIPAGRIVAVKAGHIMPPALRSGTVRLPDSGCSR